MSKPSAIITTLEDSVPPLDQRLLSAYLRTTYRVLMPAFDLRVGQINTDFDLWLAEQGAGQFVFITAWNPFSQNWPPAENERRNRALEKDLRSLSHQVLPGLGIGEGDWPPEASFCALGVSPEQAVELGQAFEQNALIFGRKGSMPELWWLREM